MKRFLLFLALLAVFLLLFFFYKEKTANPQMTIKTSNQEIPYISGSEQLFEKFMEDGLKLYQISEGEEITIEFSKKPPDKIEVLDDILNEDGIKKYSEKETGKQEIRKEGMKYIFELMPNTSAFLSSDSANYEEYSVFRGIQLNCSWGDTIRKYAFIIKANP